MIRYRPMRLKDIPECARIVASHPTLGPRYGTEIANVGALWRRLFASEWYFTHTVFEEVEGARVKVLGAGLAAFVSDDFLQEAKSPPSFWLGLEITRRVLHGNSPLLTEKQVAEANSCQGLNLLVLQTGLNPEHFKQPESVFVAAKACAECHRGFRLKEAFAQAESGEHLAGLLNFGTLLLGATDVGPRRRLAALGANCPETSSGWFDSRDRRAPAGKLVRIAIRLSSAAARVSSQRAATAPCCYGRRD